MPKTLLMRGCALWALMAGAAHAQDAIRFDPAELGSIDSSIPLILEADSMSYNIDAQTARASGNAEAFYGNRALGADVLEYNAIDGTVAASGGVILRNDDGSYVFADDATLVTDLTNGTISQPKLLIDGGGKLSAVAGERVDGRYTVLSKAVYSPCDVCVDDPEPLWQVRADRVVHDEETRDIIYQDATFDVEGVSVFYLPYFRHPDPTVERRSGFLAPQFSRDSTVGFSVKTPYFFNLAPNRDLTVTPFVTTNDGPLIEGEYRARTENGEYRLFGTGTYNNSLGNDDEFRGALSGEGRFELKDDWYWRYELDLASDDTFLRRYDYSEEDRTTSDLFVGKQTDRLFTETGLIYFQTFRPDEDSDQLPQALPEFRYNYRAVEDPDWGIVNVDVNGVRLQREQGRDYNRVGASATWQRQFVTDPGILITPFADVQGDVFVIEDDPVLSETVRSRLTGAVGVDLRYPFIAQNDIGTHVIEPIVQLVVAPNSDDDDDLPNEDSLDIEFDETNLFSLNSRFPGFDRFEGGTRANLGVRYNLETHSGLELEAVYGRVARLRENNEFSDASGLNETLSDHVGAIRLTLTPHFDVTSRVRLDGDDFQFSRNELYARGQYDRFSGTFGYVYVEADPLAGFAEDREEIFGTAALKLTDEMTLYGSARHDLQDSRFVSSGGGLRFENECCEVDVSVNRRFNDDRDANDETSIGFDIRLKTLGS